MNKAITVLMAAAMALTACTKDFQENDSLQQETLSAKLVGGSAGEIVPGSLLVKLDEGTAGKIINGRFDEVSEELLAGVEAVSFRSAIPVTPTNAEVARKYGLHQWFTVEFDAETRPQTVAAQLSKSSMVRSVQYNRLVQPVRAGDAQPFTAQPMTKADGDSGFPFNDPFAVVVQDAMQQHRLKLLQRQAGVFAVVSYTTFLIIRLNDSFALQLCFVKRLNDVKELFNCSFKLWSVRWQVDQRNAQLSNLLKVG